MLKIYDMLYVKNLCWVSEDFKLSNFKNWPHNIYQLLETVCTTPTIK